MFQHPGCPQALLSVAASAASLLAAMPTAGQQSRRRKGSNNGSKSLPQPMKLNGHSYVHRAMKLERQAAVRLRAAQEAEAELLAARTREQVRCLSCQTLSVLLLVGWCGLYMRLQWSQYAVACCWVICCVLVSFMGSLTRARSQVVVRLHAHMCAVLSCCKL
jgi:hypothetical protein